MSNNDFNTNNNFNNGSSFDNNDGFNRDIRDIRSSRPARKKKSRVGLILATVALTLTAAVAAGTAGAIAYINIHQTQSVSQTATMAVSGQKELPQAAPASAGTSESAQQVSEAGDSPAMQVAKRVYAGHNLVQTDPSSNVVLVDGEHIYMDTKHIAPENTGCPAHVYEFGQTSYGFDWTYSCDNSNFVMSCNYNFDTHQYDFVVYGTEAGSANITLYYNTGDDQQVPVQFSIDVDHNLNVTQA